MNALGRAAGLPLEFYREDHVRPRIERALAAEGVVTVGALTAKLSRDAQARARFRRSVAMPVTGLFRDPAQFELLEREILPSLLNDVRRLTVWSAACADGSELYSVALLLERLGALERAYLLGSDVLAENVAAARAPTYLRAPVPAGLRFERRDLLSEEAPRGKWRLVICRNFSIYLDDPATGRLHRLLAGALAKDGVLLLGRSERIADPETLGLARVAPHAYRNVA